MAIIENITVQPVGQQIRRPTLGAVSLADASEVYAQGLGRLAGQAGQITNTAIQINEQAMDLHDRWQKQKDDGMSAAAKVEMQKKRDEYLVQMQSKQGYDASFNADSQEWKDYEKALDDISAKYPGMSARGQEELELYKQNLTNDTVYKHSMYGVTQEKQANDANNKALAESIVGNVAGSPDMWGYMNNAQAEINDIGDRLYIGQEDPETGVNASKELFVSQMNQTMYAAAVMSAIDAQNYGYARQMINENTLMKFNETNMPENSSVLTPTQIRKFRDLLETGENEDIYSFELNKYSMLLMQNGEPSKDYSLSNAYNDIAKRYNEGQISADVANKLRAGLFAIDSEYDQQANEKRIKDASTLIMGFADAEAAGTLTPSMVQNAPRVRELLTASEYAEWMARANKASGQNGNGGATYDVDSVFVKSWRQDMFNRIDAGIIGSREDIQNHGIMFAEDGTTVLREGIDAWNLVPLSVQKEVEQRLDNKLSGRPNYVDRYLLGKGKDKVEQDLLKSYANEFIYDTGLDPYDKNNAPAIKEFISGLTLGESGEKYTEQQILRYQTMANDTRDPILIAKNNFDRNIIITPESEALFRVGVESGQDAGKVLQNFANENNWVSPSFNGWLAFGNDRKKEFNTIGKSYLIDPNLLAITSKIINKEIDILDTGRSTTAFRLRLDNPVELQKDDYNEARILHPDNTQDSIEIIANRINAEIKASNGELNISTALAKVLNQEYGFNEKQIRQILNEIEDEKVKMKRAQAIASYEANTWKAIDSTVPLPFNEELVKQAENR